MGTRDLGLLFTLGAIWGASFLFIKLSVQEITPLTLSAVRLALGALGLVVVESNWQVLPLRAVMGVGEAALFVGAAILVVELSPESRKAEAASYLSVAVFGGLSLGPIVGEWVMGDVPEAARGLSSGRYDAVWVVSALAAGLAAIVSLTAPAFVGERPERVSRRPTWFHPSAMLQIGRAHV